MSRSLWAVFLAAILCITGLSYQIVLSCIGEGDQLVRVGGEVFSTTSGTASIKLSDIPVGKIIQIGDATNGLKFVKIGDNQYLSIAPQCPDPVLTATGAQKLLTYTGSYQSYTFYAGCEYQIELWGASGGQNTSTRPSSKQVAYSSYVSGTMSFVKRTVLYIYIGEQGITQDKLDTDKTFNGGGGASTTCDSGSTGGGASDIRTISGSWSADESLRSRIIVAGGSGALGGYAAADAYGNAGGLTSYEGTYNSTANAHRHSTQSPANQTSGGTPNYISNTYNSAGKYNEPGSFGRGGNGVGAVCMGAGGGGGWYGGGGSYNAGSGSGGSSYISGHTGCVAITSTSDSSPKSGCTTGTTDNSCSISPYGYTFTNTVMIDGAGYQWTNVKGALKQMPNPTGGNYASGVGHTGNGYARITRLN